MYINSLKYFEDVFQWQSVVLHVARWMQNIFSVCQSGSFLLAGDMLTPVNKEIAHTYQ